MTWILLAVAIGVGVAACLPIVARHTPWRMEQWLAHVLGEHAPGTVCKGGAHPESVALLDGLVTRLYPVMPEDDAFPMTVDVVHGKTVNAFASLGGHIHIFEGLLKEAQSPEELAGVLAHEIEHVRHRHIIQGIALNLLTAGAIQVVLPGDHALGTQMAQLLLMLKFSRQQEAEADQSGLARLRAGRVDAAGFQQFFTRAETVAAAPAILSSHPANARRAELAAQFRGYPIDPLMDPAQWKMLRRICE